MQAKLHFPARLYQVIEIEDRSVICWELNGTAFRIADPKRFKSETIQKYFRHGNMATIQRQLNLYGFRCTNRIDEKGVFHHPQFVRGQYDAVREIRRKKTWPTKKNPRGGIPRSETVAPTPTRPTMANNCATMMLPPLSYSSYSSSGAASSSSLPPLHPTLPPRPSSGMMNAMMVPPLSVPSYNSNCYSNGNNGYGHANNGRRSKSPSPLYVDTTVAGCSTPITPGLLNNNGIAGNGNGNGNNGNNGSNSCTWFGCGSALASNASPLTRLTMMNEDYFLQMFDDKHVLMMMDVDEPSSSSSSSVPSFVNPTSTPALLAAAAAAAAAGSSSSNAPICVMPTGSVSGTNTPALTFANMNMNLNNMRTSFPTPVAGDFDERLLNLFATDEFANEEMN